MRKVISTALLGAGIVFAISSPTLSHHSHAMFDHTVEVSITGNVTDFAYRNPHVFLYVDVEEEGEMVHYWFEMSNIPNMIRRGIGHNTFAEGDEITVNYWPLKDGRPGGNYSSVIAADGTQYE
jgi:hypothetical protein